MLLFKGKANKSFRKVKRNKIEHYFCVGILVENLERMISRSLGQQLTLINLKCHVHPRNSRHVHRIFRCQILSTNKSFLDCHG